MNGPTLQIVAERVPVSSSLLDDFVEQVKHNPDLELKIRLNEPMSWDEFRALQERFEPNVFELDAENNMVLMFPVGPDVGYSKGALFTELTLWNGKAKEPLGALTGSATHYLLRKGLPGQNAILFAPDVAWSKWDRWHIRNNEQRKMAEVFVPDFVIEMRSSESQRLKPLLTKVQTFIDCGVRLGWLIDPIEGNTHVFEPGQETKVVENKGLLSYGEVLPGFGLDFARLEFNF